jgi:sulfate permease, SulP family
LKLSLAYYIASYLEMVPMACIGGILLWVASNMIKVSEIKEVFQHNKFHSGLMVYTAIMVPVTDFLTGVLSALVIFFVGRKFFDKPAVEAQSVVQKSAVHGMEQLVSMPGYFNRVTVPLAMTAADEGLLRYAAQLAKKGICKEFLFVHVVTAHEKKHNVLTEKEIKANMRKEARFYFDTALLNAKVDYRMMEGESRMDELVKFTLATQSDLILLGHHKNRTGQRSLARRLAMITNCSVWMIPEDSPAEISRILAPVDFSKPSAGSLSEATSLAKIHNVPECLALHVFFDESVIRYEEHEAIARGEEAQAFIQFVAPVDTHGVTVKPAFEESINIADAILHKAEEYKADLIVISTRGHSKAATMLLGSSTSQVMADAKIPVLAIKHFGDQVSLVETLLNSRFWEKSDLKMN